MKEVFWVAAAIAVLLIGGGLAYVCWVVADMLKEVRQTLLPNVDRTLTELQSNLNRIDELTREVDTTVTEANELVNTANRTVRSVESGVNKFNQQVYVPSLIALASAREGIKAAWGSYRAKRALKAAQAELPLVTPTPVITHRESPVIEVVSH